MSSHETAAEGLFALGPHHLAPLSVTPSEREASSPERAQLLHCLVELHQRINSDQRVSTAAQNPLMGRKGGGGVDNNMKNASVNLFPRRQIGVLQHAHKPHSSEIVLAMVTPNSTRGIQGRKCMQIEFSLWLYSPTDWITKLYQALSPRAFEIYLLAQKSHNSEPGLLGKNKGLMSTNQGK